MRDNNLSKVTAFPSCPSRQEIADCMMGRSDTLQSEKILAHIDACSTCAAVADQPLDQAIVLDDPAWSPSSPHSSIFKTQALESSAATMLKPGDKLKDRYQILSRIGKGGMGDVWRAIDHESNQIVACKVIASQLLTSHFANIRFHRETQLLRRLKDHQLGQDESTTSHVVRYLDAGTSNSSQFLIMEWIDGIHLGAVRRRVQGPSNAVISNFASQSRQSQKNWLRFVCEMLRQAALGLLEIHACGLVHRDIKPTNLLLTRQGQTKVVDLGLARSLDLQDARLTATGMVLGTIDYAAPEQLTGRRDLTAPVDVYSLGCTLQKMLTGSSPVSSLPSDWKKREAHLSANIARLPDNGLFPDWLVTLEGEMLNLNPDERPSPNQVIQAITKHVSPPPVQSMQELMVKAGVSSKKSSRHPQAPNETRIE